MSADITVDGAEATPRAGRGLFAGVTERTLWGLSAILISSLLCLAAFSYVPPLTALETRLNDLQRVIVAPLSEGQDDRVSIVALTEETLIQFPYRSPVDRGYLAELIGVLKDAGARAIVLDLIFDQPTEADKDAALIQAIRSFPGPVVAAWGDERAGLIEAQSRYIREFAEASGLVLGFANVITDDDGVVRRFATRLDGTDKYSMSGAMAHALTDETPMQTGVIDWRRPKSANATLFQQFPAIRLTHPPNEIVKDVLTRNLKDRVVFVGADLEQRDRHQTSLSVDPARRRTIPGVAIQAFVFSQLLDHRIVPNAHQWLIYGIVGGLAALGVIFGLSKWNLLWKAGTTLTALIAYLAGAFWLAHEAIHFLPISPAVAAIFMSFMLAVSLDSFLTQRNERFIRLAFSHYLEPAMVNQLADDPQALRLGGDRREMSFIFSDIQGFTTMSEELPPDQLTRLLNDYFDGMSDIIMAHGGAIDKFIGDAVVAHFGAPTPMEDHALKALQCAAEMDRFGEKFRKKNAHLGLGVTRIGVHTGVATVGNFGGRARFDYTAMGDAVNTAARLESANKLYGTRVAVSQETTELATAAAGPGVRLPVLQTIGHIRLKGKTRLVTVYTLNDEAEEEFVWAYEAAFTMLEEDSPKARAALDELYRANPTDPLVRWHLERLARGETGTVIGAA